MQPIDELTDEGMEALETMRDLAQQIRGRSMAGWSPLPGSHTDEAMRLAEAVTRFDELVLQWLWTR